MKKPKAEYRRTTITVRGNGQFPIDMLRYDNCVPTTSEDAAKIQTYSNVRYTVNLERFSFDASKAEAARWESFGWEVIEDDGA